jgi:hypothetical protein
MVAKKREVSRRRGRPVVGKEAKRLSFTMRITQTMRDKLEAAARLSGRSVSEEAQIRLENNERTFKDGLVHVFGRQWAGVLVLSSYLMRQEGDWLDDPRAFMRARNRLGALLSILQPPGTPPEPKWGFDEEGLQVVEPIVTRKPTAAWRRTNAEIYELLGEPAMRRLWDWEERGRS